MCQLQCTALERWNIWNVLLQWQSNASTIDGDGSNNDARLAGAAYVFTRSGATWSQQAYLKASNTDAFDQFGQLVSLSDDGNTLAISAEGELLICNLPSFIFSF